MHESSAGSNSVTVAPQTVILIAAVREPDRFSGPVGNPSFQEVGISLGGQNDECSTEY
jgi:hypothetical protein